MIYFYLTRCKCGLSFVAIFSCVRRLLKKQVVLLPAWMVKNFVSLIGRFLSPMGHCMERFATVINQPLLLIIVVNDALVKKCTMAF